MNIFVDGFDAGAVAPGEVVVVQLRAHAAQRWSLRGVSFPPDVRDGFCMLSLSVGGRTICTFDGLRCGTFSDQKEIGSLPFGAVKVAPGEVIEIEAVNHTPLALAFKGAWLMTELPGLPGWFDPPFGLPDNHGDGQ